MGNIQPGGPGPSEQMLLYRVEALEKLVRDLVPNNVNELQIRRIEDAIQRVVNEVASVKNEIATARADIVAFNDKLVSVAAGQDKLIIRALIALVSGVFGIILAFVSAYALHLIH